MQIQSHPSYTALPERRSRQLFNQYHSTLKDLQPVLPSSSHAPTKEQASAAQSPAQPSGMHSVPGMLRRSHAQSQDTDLTPARPAVSQLEQEVVAVEEAMADVAMQSAVAQQPTASEANPSDDALEVLRQEQAQMKREYDRMQVGGHACSNCLGGHVT